jgi:ATP-dependent DNA helicase RecG
MDEDQKASKISNLLTKLRRNGNIVNMGSDREPRWQIAEKKE